MTAPPPPDGEYFRLRAEWLRFKNHVFDTNTGLPTLSAVLDDVRRLMEERGTLALVYLDLGAEGHVEPVHGWQAYDELLRAFARTLLALRESGQLGPRDVIAAAGRAPPSTPRPWKGGRAACARISWRRCPPTWVPASSRPPSTWARR